jgi:hypothetical protein
MPGFDELLVGYRARDPRAVYADKYGGRCIACGHTVYFNASAFDVLGGGDHDPSIVCDWCYQVERDSIDAAMT